MNYENQILRVLYLAGRDGLSVRKISLHVHSACSTLFEPLDLEDVQRDVAAWLKRNIKATSPLVCRTDRRGVYAINYSSAEVRQLVFDFECANNDVASDKHDEEIKICSQLQLEF